MESKFYRMKNPLLKYLFEFLKTNEILNLANVCRRFRKILNFTKNLSKILKYIEEKKNKRIYKTVTELSKLIAFKLELRKNSD